MTTQTRGIVISGQAADGHGAIGGWRGSGPLMLSQIKLALRASELPEAWAPAAESCKAHAGEAVRQLNARGFIVRAARRSDQDRRVERATGRRWDARWTVARSSAETALVGESAGAVILTIELHGDELTCEGNAVLGAEVREIFAAKRDAEAFQAGRVTEWLARILINELGATRFGLGYYVPAGSRARANRLCAAMMARWGRSWICPLLPVATSDELRAGIARGFEEDVQAIATAVRAAKVEAFEAGKVEMSSGKAASLLRSLAEVNERVIAYRALCGDAAIRAAVEDIRGMHEELRGIAGDAAQRFALLELDAPAESPAPAPEISPAERAAERALAERRDAAYRQIVDGARAAGTEVAEYYVEPTRSPERELDLSDVQPSSDVRPPVRPRTSALPSNAAIAARRSRDTYSVPAPSAPLPPTEAEVSPDIGMRPLEWD